MSGFVSAFKPFYDSLLTGQPTVVTAVELAVAFEDLHGLTVPTVYASTAITSGGHIRDKSLSRREVIEQNNRSATLIASELLADDAPLVSTLDTMLPAELGPVPNWHDSDYMIFYFSWLSGLSVSGTQWLVGELADPAYAQVIAAANEFGKSTGDFEKANEERWPYYRTFIEIALTKLALAEGRPGGKRSDGSSVLLQLVDCEFSLGCRSEQIYADVRGLDRIAPTFGPDLPEPLAADHRELTELGAKVGADRKPVELVPNLLRR
jgi:hypothetical protein